MRIILAVTLVLACALAVPGSAQDVFKPTGFTGGLIRIFSVTTGTGSSNIGPPGDSAGDRTYRGLLLQDRSSGSIGYGTSTCLFLGRTLTSPRSICTNIYVLPLGTIVTQGIRARRDYYVLAVTGGTGLYSNVGGTLIASTVSLHPRRERLLFSLET